jgi:hypothetical protein
LSQVTTICEPYVSNKLTIAQEIPGLLNGVYDTINYIDNLKAKYIQRVWKVVFDGSDDEGWILSNVNDFGIYNFRHTLLVRSKPSTQILCDRFQRQTSGIATTTTEGALLPDGIYVYFRVKGNIATDLTMFKTWLQSNPVTVYYELATPVETIVDLPLSLISYNGVTNIITTSDPQAEITAEFNDDISSLMRNLPSDIKTYGNNVCIIDLTIGQGALDIEGEILSAINTVKASGVNPHIFYIGIKIYTYNDMQRFDYISLDTISYSDMNN